jgi:hypothetical protein
MLRDGTFPTVKGEDASFVKGKDLPLLKRGDFSYVNGQRTGPL